MLKKSIHGLFQHAKQKARFLLCFIFQSLNVLEKWRHVPIPHRRLLKREFFNSLLTDKLDTVGAGAIKPVADSLVENYLTGCTGCTGRPATPRARASAARRKKK